MWEAPPNKNPPTQACKGFKYLVPNLYAPIAINFCN